MSEHPLRILVVDDEPQIRRFLRVSLGAQGYQVDEAADGEAAITRAASLQPDLIVLDLGLPDIDGHQVIRRIREWSADPHHRALGARARGREGDGA